MEVPPRHSRRRAESGRHCIPPQQDGRYKGYGDYYIQSAAPFVNLYVNASNVIALLEGESGFHSNGTIGTSVLINCHYDSVPYAMGASDNAVFCAVIMEVLNKLSKRTEKLKNNVIFLFNGAEENPLQVSINSASDNAVFCAVMMEILSKLSKRTRKLKNNIVFLFNGAEEVGLLASHGFLKHPWAKGVTSVWGTVYHTRYDHPDLIRAGVIQNAGDTLLALVSELGDMDELNTKHALRPSRPDPCGSDTERGRHAARTRQRARRYGRVEH
ncbi:Endoplasmic reticulum metallopeptidase 1 [Operophtera brumata]|uniref:Endoplasmic reticulum metallopeptidase 1 n=1 Tax=Operophtera brumata TaxID=104452 RepID=A0A0L7LKS1_OPEBR|nr:Endoplasmic reticulum metallopeptidase 1 [Operophtera brumata]